ncbi:hypothetical protein FCM35_KLT08413 [Carex littledalei]|uniref:Uncharacterized protein n=1 Tax=Carex littledalei TaxID=544730 RepID=A0A833QXH9_9POAL|nr:hypothetical protein FCM35_KLT08413 [Carex littledalei]
MTAATSVLEMQTFFFSGEGHLHLSLAVPAVTGVGVRWSSTRSAVRCAGNEEDDAGDVRIRWSWSLRRTSSVSLNL